MSHSDAIKLEGVSVEQLHLLDDKCLVRPMPREEVRASGLFLLHGSPEHQVGSEFYATVVKVGPGSLVKQGPTPEQVAEEVRRIVFDLVKDLAEFSGDDTAGWVAAQVQTFMEQRQSMRRIPPDFKPGDQVLVKQGFGVELDLREGRHHVIERAGKFGHGILAAWDSGHVHCWHMRDRKGDDYVSHHSNDPSGLKDRDAGISVAECACGEIRSDLDTRLPACAACPPGERLAEAVLGGKHVYDVKIPDAPRAPEFDPERMAAEGFSAGELRPE